MSFFSRPLALLAKRSQGITTTMTTTTTTTSRTIPSLLLPTIATMAKPTTTPWQRPFSTTIPMQKRMSGKPNPNKAKHMDQKIYILRRYRSKRLPAPLRMGRNRYLRHWTIHRSWQLYQRDERQRRSDELMRMQQGMSVALEELRMTSGPGTRPEGYLYRLAIKKARIWSAKAIPIEYARMQVETPPKIPWNHDWKP